MKLKPKSANKSSGGHLNRGVQKLAAKPILVDIGGHVPRLQPTRQPAAGAGHPGLLPSGKKAKPVGFKFQTPRIIPVGSLSTAPPVTGSFCFF